MRRARLALEIAAGAAIAVAAGLAVLAQPAGNDTGAGPSPPPDTGPPPEAAPPPELNPPDASVPPDETPTPAKTRPTNSLSANPAPPKPPPPPPPPPVRAPTAVLQALDKVTAQTMRFAAPVGQPIRYKNLVFTVKSCETSGIGDAEPQSQAYVVIVFAPLPAGGVAPPPPKEVFKGWMFANSPSLNPFRHPVYDAWLIACMDKAPST